MGGTTRTKAPSSATLAQAKALCDSLRYRIFENLIAEPRSPMQMALHLGTHPTRLYHHFRVLEKAGLIRAGETTKKRGTVETRYEAVVNRIELGRSGELPGLVPALFAGILASTLEDLKRPRASRKRGSSQETYLKRYRIRAGPKQAAEIRAKLEAIAELCETTAASGGGREYGVTLAFYASPDSPKRRRKR